MNDTQIPHSRLPAELPGLVDAAMLGAGFEKTDAPAGAVPLNVFAREYAAGAFKYRVVITPTDLRHGIEAVVARRAAGAKRALEVNSSPSPPQWDAAKWDEAKWPAGS